MANILAIRTSNFIREQNFNLANKTILHTAETGAAKCVVKIRIVTIATQARDTTDDTLDYYINYRL